MTYPFSNGSPYVVGLLQCIEELGSRNLTFDDGGHIILTVPDGSALKGTVLGVMERNGGASNCACFTPDVAGTYTISQASGIPLSVVAA